MITTTLQTAKYKLFVRRLRKILPPMPIDIETIATGLLERLWITTATSAIRGDIGRMDDELICEMVGWHGDCNQLIDLLVECRWLDRHETYRLVVHDWHDHAPKHVKGNVIKKGGFVTQEQTQGNSEPVQESPPKDEPLGDSLKDEPLGICPPNLTNPNQSNPPPLTPPGDLAAAAAEIEILFRDIGLATAKRAARQFQDRPIDEIQRAINDYRANKSKLSSPNSVVFFLENAAWPVEGVRPAVEANRATGDRKAKQLAKLRESVRCDVAADWKRSGRWAKASENEIDAEIDRRMAKTQNEKVTSS